MGDGVSRNRLQKHLEKVHSAEAEKKRAALEQFETRKREEANQIVACQVCKQSIKRRNLASLFPADPNSDNSYSQSIFQKRAFMASLESGWPVFPTVKNVTPSGSDKLKVEAESYDARVFLNDLNLLPG